MANYGDKVGRLQTVEMSHEGQMFHFEANKVMYVIFVKETSKIWENEHLYSSLGNS